MPILIQDEWQLFALDSLGENLAILLGAQIQPIRVDTKFSSDTEKSPRVELELTIGAPEGHVHIRYPGSQWQPYDAWIYDLTATIVTERTQNGSLHASTIGRVRYAFQYFRLLQSLTTAVSPYHTLTTIAESQPQQDSVDDVGNLQMTKLTFSGVMNIRENAWPNA